MKFIIFTILLIGLVLSCTQKKKNSLGYLIFLEDKEVYENPMIEQSKFICPKGTISEIFYNESKKYKNKEDIFLYHEIICNNKIVFDRSREGYHRSFNRAFLESNQETMELLFDFSQIFTRNLDWYSYKDDAYRFMLDFVPNYDELCYGWKFEPLFGAYQCSKVIKNSPNNYSLINENIQLDLVKNDNGITIKIKKKTSENIDQYGTTEIFRKLDAQFWKAYAKPKYDPNKLSECTKESTREGYEKCKENAIVVVPVQK